MRTKFFYLLSVSILVLLLNRTETSAAPVYNALVQVSGSGFSDSGSGSNMQRVAAGMFSNR